MRGNITKYCLHKSEWDFFTHLGYTEEWMNDNCVLIQQMPTGEYND